MFGMAGKNGSDALGLDISVLGATLLTSSTDPSPSPQSENGDRYLSGVEDTGALLQDDNDTGEIEGDDPTIIQSAETTGKKSTIPEASFNLINSIVCLTLYSHLLRVHCELFSCALVFSLSRLSSARVLGSHRISGSTCFCWD
jgi:hypothetical protein